MGSGKVLLVMDSVFFIDKNTCLDPILNSSPGLNQELNRIMDSYMVVSMISMLRKNEVKQIFIDDSNTPSLNEENSSLLDVIDGLSSQVLEVKACDIYVDQSFKKGMLNYVAIGEFTVRNIVGNTSICKIKYNNQEANQNQKNTYLNRCDITSPSFLVISHYHAQI
ncbi:MAG: hypothetical protein QS748_14050 [Candidatus Endonucleobacter bathymodioli]|uniref:Uncharacterized protein n=1 Tax=Candidatus Endonucleibacter bathymodioli TaxID=539814 RepID=A0AA90P166_9GAMM|nr:hypothetical protein [Candidatus Endonucleobacter bathymodioli]